MAAAFQMVAACPKVPFLNKDWMYFCSESVSIRLSCDLQLVSSCIAPCDCQVCWTSACMLAYTRILTRSVGHIPVKKAEVGNLEVNSVSNNLNHNDWQTGDLICRDRRPGLMGTYLGWGRLFAIMTSSTIHKLPVAQESHLYAVTQILCLTSLGYKVQWISEWPRQTIMRAIVNRPTIHAAWFQLSFIFDSSICRHDGHDSELIAMMLNNRECVVVALTHSLPGILSGFSLKATNILLHPQALSVRHLRDQVC